MAFLAGILLLQQFAVLPDLAWGGFLVPALFVAWRFPACWPIFFFALGFFWAGFRAELILAQNLPPQLEGKDVTLTGRIAEIPKTTDYGVRFVFEIEGAQQDGQPVRLPARVLLSWHDKGHRPRADERYRFTARLQQPHGLQNPGGFDYEAYLFRNRIRAKGYVREQPAFEKLPGGNSAFALNRTRQALGETISAHLADSPYRGVLVALANGDANDVPQTQWDVFRRTGTVHLVAISGLHITLVAGIVFFLVRFLWALPGTTVLIAPASVVAAFAGLLAATVYAALAGFVVPTQRALLMLAVAFGFLFTRRAFAPSQALAGALLAVLAFDPMAVMAQGFWLSFAAVAVILFVASARRQEGVLKKFGKLQWSVALGLLPLTLVLFQQVSLVSPLANLLAIPVFDFLIVPLVLLGIVALAVLPDAVGGIFFQLASHLLGEAWPALEWMSRTPLAVWHQHEPPWWAVASAVAGGAWLLAPRGVPARLLGVIALLPIFLITPPKPAPGELWFTLLDVGQGLSAVVRTHHHVLVFDTGPRLSRTFDAGEAVVVPYLRAKGVRDVDTLFLSHGDNDHVGGADSVLQAFGVRDVVTSVPERFDGARACEAEQTWEWDGVYFSVLNPPPGKAGGDNNASCVLKVQSAHGTVLLPGDIEKHAEACLVRRYGDTLSADVLVAPHHGSKTSSTCTFIDHVSPRYVLFPTGYHNRYRHPNERVLARYADRDVARLDSPASGSIEMKFTATGMTAEIYRAVNRRYWFVNL